MSALTRSMFTNSIARKEADDALDRAVIFLTNAIDYLDRACALDPDLAKRVNAVEHQDELGTVRNALRSIALDQS